MRDIPQDIYSEILQSQLLDCDGLKTCSLVCRAWLSATSSLLFRAIKLWGEQAFRDFKAVITDAAAMRSNIAYSVRKVTLSDLSLNLDNLPCDAVASSLVVRQLLSSLPSLRTLQLDSIEWSHATDPGLPVYFVNMPITCLQFSRTRLPSPGHLLRLAASLPCLSILSISFIEWDNLDLDDSDLSANRGTPHTIQLQSLKVYKCFNARGFLRGLLSPPFDLRLTNLEWALCDMSDEASPGDQVQHELDEAPVLCTLLQACSTTLAELRLSTYWEDEFLEFVSVIANTPVKIMVLSAFRPADTLPYDTYSNSLPLFLKANAPALSCLHELEIRLGIFDRYAMCWGMDWEDVDSGLATLRASCPALMVTLRITFVSHAGYSDPLEEDLQSLAEIVEGITHEMHEYLLPSSLNAGLPVRLVARLYQPGEREADAEEQEHWL